MQEKVRVLHIIKTLGLGGAETNLLNLAQAFDPDRVETHVAYSWGGEIEPRFRAAGVTLFKYAEQSHRIKSLQSLAIVARLASYIRRQRIDIVHTHNFNGHIWGLLAAKLAGAKVVEHVHDFRYVPAPELQRRHGLLPQYRFIRWFRRRSDRIIVLTGANKDHVLAEGFAGPGQVIELHNGIDLRTRRDRGAPGVRQRHGLAEDAVVVLTGARMDPSKNIELIVRIAPAVLAAEPRTVFVIAGSGPHLAQYQAQAQAAGLERQVRFIGFQSDMNELMAAADVFLLPSFLELHSIAILEALRMQLPVVVSAGVGCNDEFISHDFNGYLCDPFRDEPWIGVLRALCADAGLRERIGERGYETCERRFDIRHTARRMETLFAELAAA